MSGDHTFDWTLAEAQLVALGETNAHDPGGLRRSDIRLADVAGQIDVKARLEAAFLAPLRNPELRVLYKKSLGGGLLLYGPPDCGMTYLARAIAGELDARFLSVSLATVLGGWSEQRENNIRALFERARASAPCVVFLDGLDALGRTGAALSASATRATVNQLLHEIDATGGANEGVFVLGATNRPWDVDSTLLHAGRLDRTLFVSPPDAAAREALLSLHLQGRSVDPIDLNAVARATDGFSGADLAHLCEVAAEGALMEGAQAGIARNITQTDVDGAAKEVRPSPAQWLMAARNVALAANEGGAYDELIAYLRSGKMP